MKLTGLFVIPTKGGISSLINRELEIPPLVGMTNSSTFRHFVKMLKQVHC